MTERALNGQTSSAALRVAFETLGCRSNFADTIDLQAAVVEHGAIPCGFASEADVYVLNTCSVTDAADRDAVRLIRRIKRTAPKARLIVTGCLAEVGKERLESLELCDTIIGPGNRAQVLRAILSGDEDNCAPQISARVTPLSSEILGPGTMLGEIPSRARFHLRVQEGCENSCTFCIVPQSRGRFVSKPVKTLLSDVRHLEEAGYEEIVLTGTHLGGYGVDIGSSLYELLVSFAENASRCRIRLSSIDPNDLDRQILEVLSKSNVFCEHLHICVQAFSDSVLKRMNRRYRLAEVIELIGEIVEHLPRPGLGSDVITGFPGESREDFEEQIEVFMQLPFTYLHVFPYSEREDTAATRLPGTVSMAERKRRAGRLRALAEEKKQGFYRSLIGEELEVVLETKEDDCWCGTSREYVFAAVSDQPGLCAGKTVRARGSSLDVTNGRLLCELLNQESYMGPLPSNRGGNDLRVLRP